MDIITHALAGRAIGRISGRGGRVAAIAGAAGAVLPDVDSLVLVFPALEGILERRGALHSCAGVLFWAAVVSAACLLHSKYKGSARFGMYSEAIRGVPALESTETESASTESSEAAREFESEESAADVSFEAAPALSEASLRSAEVDPATAESGKAVGFSKAPALAAMSLWSKATVPFVAALLGGMSHLLLDVITPWGVPLLWPFGSYYALGIIRGFDPWITLLVLVLTYFVRTRGESRTTEAAEAYRSGEEDDSQAIARVRGSEDMAVGGSGEHPASVAGGRWRRSTEESGILERPSAADAGGRGGRLTPAAWMGFLMLGYLILRLVLQASSLSGLSAVESRNASSYALSATNPFSWRLVVRTEDAIDIYRVVVPGAPEKLLSFPFEHSPCIGESRKGPVASRYLASAKYPYATVVTTDQISTVTWRDMRDQLPHIYRSGEVMVRIECGTGEILEEEKTTWLDHFIGGTFFGKPR